MEKTPASTFCKPIDLSQMPFVKFLDVKVWHIIYMV